ncbi:unnamed protein product [Pedinophyceae sp. YPF-701]|nr:unnamed protein product [Pedinophyceae sp. YPF-701]
MKGLVLKQSLTAALASATRRSGRSAAPRFQPVRAEAARGPEPARSSAVEFPHPAFVSRDDPTLLVPEKKELPLGKDRLAAGLARKTKIVCTIGPGTASVEMLTKLAEAGMNVARLNMSHGDHSSHLAVINMVKEINAKGFHCIGLLLDTKGPEIRSGDLREPLQLQRHDRLVLTIREGAQGQDNVVSINYDGFVDDVGVGDMILVDGGIMSFKCVEVTGTDIVCEVMEGGQFKSRRHLNIRGKSASLPSITDKDWDDITFGVENGVDFIALSFVKEAQTIRELKEWLEERGSHAHVLPKIESATSVQNLEEILDVSDGAMVARGDLGAELPVQEVPYWQSRIVQGCRRRGKNVIVATNMLESMIENPTPTRAEVSDISIAVREGTDAVMLSGETAYGKYPLRSVQVMSRVALTTEASMLSYRGARRFGTDESERIDWIRRPKDDEEPTLLEITEMFAYHTTMMANTLKAPIVAFSRYGTVPRLLSHYRPDNRIFCFTESTHIQRLLTLAHGVVPIKIGFGEGAEETIDRALSILVERGLTRPHQQVALVRGGVQPIWKSTDGSTHAIHARRCPDVVVDGEVV